jgi:hypothetical protein
MIELTPRYWALYFRTVSFRISRFVKGVLVCAEIFLLLFVLTLAFSVDAPAMSFRLNICKPSVSYKCTADSVELRSFQRQASLNLLSEPAQTLRDPPVAREGILRIKGQPVSILAVFVAPPVALLLALTAMTFIPPGKFSGFANFFLLGFLGVGVAAIVTAILGQFEDYSPAIQQFCLAEGFIAGALASFRRFWSSGGLTENRPKGGRAL